METVTGLQYSCCNEDVGSELNALQVQGRRVISIAAAGERAFGLLLGDPREVIAIDRNPVQVHLGRLKVAGMRRLEREAYLGFIGISPAVDARAATYQRLRADLPDEARAYWDAHPADIAEGIHSVGRTERSIARAAPALRRVLAADVARLRACKSLAEQAALAEALFQRWSVRLVLALIFNPVSGRLLLRDPVYYGQGRRAAAPYLRQRVVTTLAHHRFDDCFILSLFLDGHLRNARSLPVDLAEDTYPVVQSRLDRLRFETSCVSEYLARQSPGSIDGFSLSDLGGYLTIDEFSTLLERVQRAASNDARVCIREYISAPTERAAWPTTLVRSAALEAQLDREDRSVGCTFVCATKTPAAALAA
jgi:S-adenosylmethionine-diacylglycerol 3-amino-3-carboxypropyl transferase